MSVAATSALRRGACPGLAAPMPTGDGLLARLPAAGSTLGLDATAALADAARRHGNGIIEVTARGSIQIRGLTAASAPAFADTVAALDIDPGDSVPILLDPLSGLAPSPAIDGRPVAAALRERLARASTLPGPKVSAIIDGGDALHLDAVAADVRLRAAGSLWQVALGGDAATATALGAVRPEHAAEVAARLIEAIAKQGPHTRARDLVREHGTGIFRSAIADLPIEAAVPSARPLSQPIGAHALHDGRFALGIALAFGHTDATALDLLIAAAQRARAAGLRTAPGRALLVVGVAADALATLAADAERAGFITRANDPRRHLVACAGAPICAAAEIPTRALAPSISADAIALLDGSLTLHVSGCRKGCAHATAAALTVVGSAQGCGLVIAGTARDQSAATVAKDELPAALARIARAVKHKRQDDESANGTLARLGAERIAALFGAGPHG
jgi:precorrin-3B synthase